jgi:NRPS condensation-like uncharacterized protein
LSALHKKGVRLWREADLLRYSDPRKSITPEDIEGLRAFKGEILEALPKTYTALKAQASPLTYSSGVAPITLTQQWMFRLMEQYPSWNVVNTFAFRLTGRPNLEALRKSFDEIIKRHSALRSRMVRVGGVPHQQIDASSDFHWELLRLPDASVPDLDVLARVTVEKFLNKKVDVTTDRLINVGLLRLSQEIHIVALSIHHIVVDGFSQSLIFRELWLVYSELLRGMPSPLGSSPMQCADYAIWQHETGAAWRDDHEDYWRHQLNGAAPIQLPRKEEIRTKGDQESAQLKIVFPRSNIARAREFAHHEKSLLPLLFLTALSAAVFKTCGQRDFIVPFNVSGRISAEHEEVVGYLSYALHITIKLTGQETYRELLHKVTREFFCALGHQDFGRIALQSPNLSTRGLVIWLPWDPDELEGLPRPEIADKLNVAVEKFEHTFQGNPPEIGEFGILCYDTGKTVVMHLGYRSDHFGPDTMAVFSGHIQSSFERAWRGPGVSIAQIDDVSEPRQRQSAD